MVLIVLNKPTKDTRLGLVLEGNDPNMSVKKIRPGLLASQSELEEGMVIVAINDIVFPGSTEAIDYMKTIEGEIEIDALLAPKNHATPYYSPSPDTEQPIVATSVVEAKSSTTAATHIDMIAPCNLEPGKIIKAFDGTKMVDVCVPTPVKAGEQFSAIIIGTNTQQETTSVPMGREEEPKIVKASPAVTTPSPPPAQQNLQVVNVHTSTNSPTRLNTCMATAGLTLGIIGLFVFLFGFLLGVLAVIFSGIALSRVSSQPELYGGKCQATAGLVLGIIDIVGWIIALSIYY